jgi:hypothetical protein
VMDLPGIRREGFRRVDRHDLCPTRGRPEVAGERGDATSQRRIGRDECVTQDAGVLSNGRCLAGALNGAEQRVCCAWRSGAGVSGAIA